MFSFMAYANLATSPKRLETKLANITRRHFSSLPVFCIEHFFICFLFSEFFPLICLFWHTLTARDNTRDRDANSSRQNDVTWCDFFVEETSRALAPSLAFAAENRKNIPLALRPWTRQHPQTDLQGSGKKNVSAVFSSELFFCSCA